MAKIIEITEKKMDKLSDLVEGILLKGGELMHCLTKMEDEMYGERSRGGDRYGTSSKHRDDDRDWDDDRDFDIEEMLNKRRRYRRMR